MKNRYQELLEKVDAMSIEEIEDANNEISEKYNSMLADKESKEKQTKQTKPTKLAKEQIYKGITSFRYGAMNLYSELGLDHNNEYSKEMLIKILLDHGYFEFDPKSTDFSQHPSDGTVVITIKGNSKGNVLNVIPCSILEEVESYFKDVFKQSKTEARKLIYLDDNKTDYYILCPKQKNTVVSTISDIDFNININGVNYNLTFDFHSHHLMGAIFSKMDDANEKFRGIIYGVFSWRDNIPQWSFRYWNGKEFCYLNRGDIIGY